MHVIPTPAKGGRYLNYLCTEFCRFLVWLGHTTVGLKCDQEPSTLSLLEAVKKTCRGLGIQTITETVPPGSHASNGAAEVTVKVIRQQANLLIDQLEKGCGLGQTFGCHHPLYHWALLHSSWLHNRFVIRKYRDVNSALNPLYIAMCNCLLVENYSKLEQTVCAETKCMQEAWTNTCAISAGFVVTKDVFMVERSLMIQRFW